MMYIDSTTEWTSAVWSFTIYLEICRYDYVSSLDGRYQIGRYAV